MRTTSIFQNFTDQESLVKELLDIDRFRLCPCYERASHQKIQKYDFTPFLKELDHGAERLMILLSKIDNAALKERIQDMLNKILFQKKVYMDKVVYTLRTSDVKPFTKICLMLHGMLDCAENFAKLAPEVDDVLYVVPQAFKTCYPLPGIFPLAWNYQWFSLGSGSFFKPNPATIKEGLEENRPFLLQWIDDLALLVGGYEHVIVCGFSQGAVVALDLLTQSQLLKYVISVAGGMHPDISLVPSRVIKKALLIHCPKDRIVPFYASKDAEKRLLDLGAEVELRQPIKHGHLIFTDTLGQKCMKDFIKGDPISPQT